MFSPLRRAQLLGDVVGVREIVMAIEACLLLHVPSQSSQLPLNYLRGHLIGKFCTGSDGVGVKFPIFAVNGGRFSFSSERIRRKAKKTKKSEAKEKIHGKVPPTPSIYTNPMANLPT